MIGDGGWLFLSDEFYSACRPGRPPAEVLAAASRLGSIVRRSGRRFVIAVAPDKSSVVPDRVPDDYALADCAAAAGAGSGSALCGPRDCRASWTSRLYSRRSSAARAVRST